LPEQTGGGKKGKSPGPVEERTTLYPQYKNRKEKDRDAAKKSNRPSPSREKRKRAGQRVMMYRENSNLRRQKRDIPRNAFFAKGRRPPGANTGGSEEEGGEPSVAAGLKG